MKATYPRSKQPGKRKGNHKTNSSQTSLYFIKTKKKNTTKLSKIKLPKKKKFERCGWTSKLLKDIVKGESTCREEMYMKSNGKYNICN